MRNKHTIEVTVKCRCPFEECGKTFYKKVKFEYVTNQRGDVIEYKIL